MNRIFHLAAAALTFALALEGRAFGLTIQLDYRYDTSNFFSGANLSRRTPLEAAAATFSTRLTDDLLSIVPSGGDEWSAIFFSPASGLEVELSDLSIAADTLLVFVGARELGASTLGEGGPGGFSGSGSLAWLDRIEARGETGALSATPTDFGPWGGSLTFDLTANWYFDSNVETVEPFGSQSDFYSVALHELAHLLGIGTAESWDTKISGGAFRGAAAEELYDGPVPLDGNGAHWANGVQGHLEGSGVQQEAAMAPSIVQGTRKYFTDLDFAALQDVG